jgi:hypothetical protein
VGVEGKGRKAVRAEGLSFKSDGVRRVPVGTRSAFLFTRLTLCHPLSSSPTLKSILSDSFTSLSLSQTIWYSLVLSRLFSWLAHVLKSLECLPPLP